MRINSKQQIQYFGPDSTEAEKTQTQNETSLGIGATKNSFEMGKSIPDGTSKEVPNRLMQEGITLQNDLQNELQKDLDAKRQNAIADGSVVIGLNLSPGSWRGFNPQPDPPVVPLQPAAIKDFDKKMGGKD